MKENEHYTYYNYYEYGNPLDPEAVAAKKA